MVPRIVFMGSPAFALPSLQILADQYPLVGVVTQPDRPAGRGRTPTPPPVKSLALSLGVPVIQPRRLREPQALDQLRAWQPDVIVVVAFGQILRPEVLELPRFGCINVHASLLPRWRGAAPVQAALLHGDAQTGVTIMRMDLGVDTGPLLSQRVEPVFPSDTAATLSNRLAHSGADLLSITLPVYLNGSLQPLAQPETGATYAPLLRKEDGLLDFSRPAEALARQVRAFYPWPGTYTVWQGSILKIHRAHADSSPTAAALPGTPAVHNGLPALHTGNGLLVLDEVQPAGRKALSGKVFLHGARDWQSGQ
jgi:methionyl-tRNA formyltransferase